MVQPAPNLTQSNLIREDYRYSIYDLELKDTTGDVVGTVSTTVLKPGQDTRGHKHTDKDEWYFFKEGVGVMYIDNVGFEVCEDSAILVTKGHEHQVLNRGIASELKFITFFSGVSERPDFVDARPRQEVVNQSRL